MLKHQFVKSVQINYVLLQTLTWQQTAMSVHQQAAVIRPIQTDFGFRSHSSEHKPWNIQKTYKTQKNAHRFQPRPRRLEERIRISCKKT